MIRVRRAAVAALFTAGVLVVGGISGPAFAADDVSAAESESEAAHIDAILAPTRNDDLLLTLAALSNAGLYDAGSVPHETFSMELDDTNDSLIIRYWADHPAAERFVEAVRGARAESPLALELEELDVDLRRLHAVAHELTRPDSAVAAALGIVPTVAVVDEASGSVVVEIVDDGSGRFDGDRSSSVVVDGVVVQIRPGGAEVEFQAGA